MSANQQSLVSLIKYHNDIMKTQLEWGTLKNYGTTQKYITMFLDKHLRTSDVFLSQLNYKFLVDFEMFLKAHQPTDHQKPCGQNTAMKHIERFRKMINMAIKYEWLEKDPFQKFKASFKKTSRESLTMVELTRIEEKVFTIPKLQQVKDLFIFSCYTGLAYADVMKLKPSDVILGMDGKAWITTSRKKTDMPVRIPLLGKANEIIKTYKNHPAVLAAESLLPNISNQKLNSYLKEIADLCGVQKNLTFHLARHTFATTITLTNGVPIETVSKLLGHSGIRTTQIYAKVIEKKVSDDMEVLRQKIEGVSLNITQTQTGS
ncbi:MAG: site-specific integrase [Opitutaceae bacterium]|nr:site-specific integrase [Cytophagales bacterium]